MPFMAILMLSRNLTRNYRRTLWLCEPCMQYYSFLFFQLKLGVVLCLLLFFPPETQRTLRSQNLAMHHALLHIIALS